MTFPLVSLAATFILCTFVNGEDWIGFTLYSVNIDIINVNCYNQHVVFTSHRKINKISCVSRCLDDLECRSIFYSVSEEMCVGCSRKYSNGFGLPTETRAEYIVGKTNSIDFKPSLYELKGKMDFYQGVDKCAGLGGHMLQVDSEEKNDNIATIFGETSVIWLGLVDEKTEGKWEWYNYTSQTGFTNWWENFFRPVSRPDENCAVMVQQRGFLWSNRDCSKKNTLVCEF